MTMDREKALQLQAQGKPCVYIGRFEYLRGKWLYIKHVTNKGLAVVASNLNAPGYNDYHEIKLENLTPAE